MRRLQPDPAREFKPIRNRIGKYSTSDIILRTLERLHRVEGLPTEKWEGWLPWYLLALSKWGIQYGGTQYPPKPFLEDDLRYIVNMIHKFDEICGSPFLSEDGHTSLPKFLRITAYQQFWLQSNIGKWELARQRLLFSGPYADKHFQDSFYKHHHITTDLFIEYILLLWSWALQNSDNMIFRRDTIFSKLNIDIANSNAFFKAVCIPLQDARGYLNERLQSIRNLAFQLLETTPFVMKPILINGDAHLICSRRVLERTIRDFQYNEIKRLCGSEGAERFARVLEIYVSNALRSANIEYYPEALIRAQYPESKVTDFVVPLQDRTVLLEVKAKDIRPTVRVYPNNRQLISELRDNVIKGIVQGYWLASALLHSPSTQTPINSSSFCLIIITYKDFFLGGGKTMWDEFLKDAVIPALQEADIDPHIIPPENIFVISLDEYDRLIAVLKGTSHTLSSVLDHALSNNNSPETTKFSFRQHLDSFFSGQLPLEYLDTEFKALVESAGATFGNK